MVAGKVRTLASLAHNLALRLGGLGLLALNTLLLGFVLGGRFGSLGGLSGALGGLGLEPLHLVLQLALIFGVLQIRLIGLVVFAGAVRGVVVEAEAVESTLLLQHDLHLALLVVGAVYDILLLVLLLVNPAVGKVELEVRVVGHLAGHIRLLLLLLLLYRALTPQLELLVTREAVLLVSLLVVGGLDGAVRLAGVDWTTWGGIVRISVDGAVLRDGPRALVAPDHQDILVIVVIVHRRGRHRRLLHGARCCVRTGTLEKFEFTRRFRPTDFELMRRTCSSDFGISIPQN